MSVFLTDFGLARATATGSRYTRTGEALGTPAYMSPEQARGSTPLTAGGESTTLTPAADVWSLGCVLYECLAGRPAFEGGTAAEVIGRVLTAEPARLRAVRPGLPPGAEHVVRVALARPAHLRYPSARAFRDDLDRVRRGESPLARVRGARGRRMAATALAAGLVGGLAWLLHSPVRPLGAPPPPPAIARAESLAGRARALRSSDPGEAARLLATALADAPGRHDWRLERGLLLWAVGEAAEARAEWRTIPADAPEATEATLYRGLEAFFRLATKEECGPDLEAAARSPGRHGRLARGALAALHRRWDAARTELGGLEGWEAALLQGYVETVDPSGDAALADRAYTRALADGIPFAWAFNNRGVARHATGDLAGELGDYERALQLNPREAGAYANRGALRSVRGDLAGALADYDRAVALNPRGAAGYGNRGIARRATGDLVGAMADYDRAVELDPELAEAFHSRGNARQAAGDLAGAIADFDRAVAINPRYAKAFVSRGLARRARGERSGALADYDRALAIDPGLPDVHYNRGVARGAEGDLAGAIADLDRAIEGNPRDADAYAARATARGGQGDLAGAVADCERALAVAPAGWAARAETERKCARARAALR